MEKQMRQPLPPDASPKEKYDNFILTIFEEWQSFAGEKIDLDLPDEDYLYLGFEGREEFDFYCNSLASDGLANLWEGRFKGDPPKLSLTFSGLNYCLSLLESGKNSNKCFVAMAFGIPEMDKFYDEAINQAIEANDFRPIRVDKEHTENEQTINDFIIASIKQSRFCIADLTYQRNGVYFEAGYALGRGLKVIYTCLRDDHENVHFDLKTMQTILYDTPEELRDALDWKIKAVINE